MNKPLDLIGKRYGRLLVISRQENNRHGQTKWLCLCDCGKHATPNGRALVAGHSQSCGCISAEKITLVNKTHGKTRSKEYNSWRGMKERCTNPNNSHYHLYGERGISYCEDWELFENFYRDMGDCPEGYQLERCDVNLGYSKDNCIWDDKTQQAFNIRLKSNNKTGKTGVTQRKNGKFYASITIYKKVIFLGVFLTFEKAKEAREKAELQYYGFVKE